MACLRRDASTVSILRTGQVHTCMLVVVSSWLLMEARKMMNNFGVTSFEYGIELNWAIGYCLVTGQ